MDLLSTGLANKVVRKIKNVLPYPISIMDAGGIIIASSDPSQVGKLHNDSLQCLRFKEIIETQGDPQIQGVTAPLFLDNAVLGVIGISGDPEKVRVYIALAKIAAELLIEQANTEHKRQHRRQSIDEFISEWVFSLPPYSPSLIERGRNLNIPINPDYYIMLISEIEDMAIALRHIRETLRPHEYWHGMSTKDYLLTIPQGSDALYKAKVILQKFPCKVGIGRKEDNLRTSLEQAKLAIKYGKIFHPDQHIYFYDNYAFIHLIADIGGTEIDQTIDKLASESKALDFWQTLRTYMEYNGDITDAAQTMFVHRNTLKYRLERIYEITGKNPRRFEDLFYLYIALVRDTIHKQEHPASNSSSNLPNL